MKFAQSSNGAQERGTRTWPCIIRLAVRSMRTDAGLLSPPGPAVGLSSTEALERPAGCPTVRLHTLPGASPAEAISVAAREAAHGSLPPCATTRETTESR
jgi:hypothetical protein